MAISVLLNIHTGECSSEDWNKRVNNFFDDYVCRLRTFIAGIRIDWYRHRQHAFGNSRVVFVFTPCEFVYMWEMGMIEDAFLLLLFSGVNGVLWGSVYRVNDAWLWLFFVIAGPSKSWVMSGGCDEDDDKWKTRYYQLLLLMSKLMCWNPRCECMIYEKLISTTVFVSLKMSVAVSLAELELPAAVV